MENLKEMQEFTREKIIMACHPEAKSYEEALEKELGFGCEFVHKGETATLQLGWECFRKNQFSGWELFYDGNYSRIKIIGKPLTLNKVILAIHNQHLCMSTNAPIFGLVADTFYVDVTKELWNWDLTKETLEEQTPDIQLAIAKLLGWGQDV